MMAYVGMGWMLEQKTSVPLHFPQGEEVAKHSTSTGT